MATYREIRKRISARVRARFLLANITFWRTADWWSFELEDTAITRADSAHILASIQAEFPDRQVARNPHNHAEFAVERTE